MILWQTKTCTAGNGGASREVGFGLSMNRE